MSPETYSSFYLIKTLYKRTIRAPCSVTAAKFNKCIYFTLIFIARKLSMGLIIRYPSLKIVGRIIIHKPNIFTGTRTQGSFRVCNLCYCNLPSEANNFVLGSVLLSCLVTKLQKSSSPVLKPKTYFRGYGFYPVISQLKQVTLILAPFFYRA
jgi:hypothetical protein